MELASAFCGTTVGLKWTDEKINLKAEIWKYKVGVKKQASELHTCSK